MQSEHKDYNRGHRRRLTQKFINSGIEALHEYEAVELLLTYVIPQQDVKPPAKALLERFRSLKGMLDAEIDDLKQIGGIGDRPRPSSNSSRKRPRSTSSRRRRRKSRSPVRRNYWISAERPWEAKRTRSSAVIYLDAQNQIIEFETVQKGVVNQAVVYPRQVLEAP